MSKAKILIVEDNPIVAEDIRIKLSRMGYEVTATATSGKDALEAAGINRPDISLMDIQLGEGMNGIEVARELRRKYQVPVVYLTAYADENTIERVKYTEPLGYIIKPFDDKELQPAIEIALYKHQMERELRISEEWLQTALTSIGDGIITTDMEGRVTFMNPVAESLTGWTKLKAAGKPVTDVFHIINELTGEPCENPVAKVIEAGQIIGLTSHTLLKSRDGREIPIKDSGAPIVLNEKEILGVILVFQDDTENRKAQKAILRSHDLLKREVEERRHTEQKLNDNARMLHETQQLTLTGTWEYDPKTEAINWSEQTYANYGIDPQQQINRKTLYEIIHPDFRRYHEENEKLLFQRGENIFEYPILMPDEKIRWIFATAKVFYDEKGVPARVYGLTQNITERKIAELNLKESERKLSTLVGNLPGMAYRCVNDKNWTMSFMSDGCKVVTGYEPSEIIDNRELAYNDLIVSDDRQHVWDEVQSRLDEQRPFTLEYRIRDKHGMEKWIWERGLCVDKQEGGTLILEGFISDITERKRAESEKIKLETQLAQAQKLESIGNLAGGIAHDFNNILSSILGFTELALEDAGDDAAIVQDLQEVYKAGIRARDLVKQILTFARQADEERRPIPVDLITKEVLGFLRSSIPTSIEIKYNVNSRSLIMANATQVHQVLMNLCTNAAHAMENEGGVLELDLNDVVVDRSEEWKKINLKPGHFVEIEVSDTGHGIPPEILDSIFDPYFTTKDPGEGTGMGLAVVHSIVETHEGRIIVHSTLGRGTTFTVYLPITAKHRTHGSYEPESLPSGTEKILFVDDEAPIARIGHQILSRLGYSVTTRTSSVEALELFKTKPEEFDLVVTDMTMPNMTGDKLAIELMKIQPDIPVIISTGYSKKISDDTALEIGIRAFTYKPIVRAELAKTIRRVLDETNNS